MVGAGVDFVVPGLEVGAVVVGVVVVGVVAGVAGVAPLVLDRTVTGTVV
ncbi:MAG: hypothetical protein KGL79_08335 [Acidobacteriota bacterium]|nr:hypothetical protein [Acidobacteriota bacterium]